MPTREELQRLITSLPDDALPAAHMALTHLQTWPPPELADAIELSRQFEERTKDRVERLRRDHPGSGGGGGWMMVGNSDAVRSRNSFQYDDGGDAVHESDIVHDGHTFKLVERIRRDEPANAITFTLELTGPDGATARHEHSYGLP